MAKTPFTVSSFIPSTAVDPHKIGYEDSIGIIQDELLKTKKSFVKIGWYLKHIQDDKMYEQDGYTDIFALAQDKFGITASTANRFMNVCAEFSIGGDSPELDEKYLEYSVSQLFEMLPMKSEDRDDVSPEMSVKEIREVKKDKDKKALSDKDVKRFFELLYGEYHPSRYEDESILAKELKASLGASHTGGNDCGVSYSCTPRGISLGGSDEVTWKQFAKRAFELFPKKDTNEDDGAEIIVESSSDDDVYSEYEQDHVSQSEKSTITDMSKVNIIDSKPVVRELTDEEKQEYDKLTDGAEQMSFDISQKSDDVGECLQNLRSITILLERVLANEKQLPGPGDEIIKNMDYDLDVISTWLLDAN